MPRFFLARAAATAALVACLGAWPRASVNASDTIPAPPQSRTIALVGGTLYPVSGPPIEKGTLLLAKGKITAIGPNVTVPDGAEVVDLTGKRIYPGLFDALSDIGLSEIDSVRATLDARETGSINPSVKAWVAVNPDSEIIPVTRSNGVLISGTAPSGGIVSGLMGVLQLDGWTNEDLVLKAPVGLVVNWPSVSQVPMAARRATPRPADDGKSPLDSLKQLLEQTRAYETLHTANPKAPTDLGLEAMRPVVRGELPLIVEANDLARIQSAVAFADKEHLKLIIYGGYDAPLCPELLKEHQVPVIVEGINRLPLRRGDSYDRPYRVAEELQKSGVAYCIAASSRHGSSNARSLPYHAAMAVGFGLPAEAALRAITLSPAEILSVADRVGSLDVGKDATLFITNGDPLEAPTQVLAAYVQGRKLDLSDRHKQLYQKYKTKYDQQGVAPLQAP